MACNSISISASSIATTNTKDKFIKQKYLRKSHSASDIYNGGRIKRSSSDHNISYSVTRIHGSTTESKLKNSCSAGKFRIQISGSIIRNPLQSFNFNPKTDKNTMVVEKEEEMEKEEEIADENIQKKRSNWMERLLEIRSHWRGRQQSEEDEDGVCEVNYSDDEKEMGANIEGEVTYDRDSFSRLLSRVDWSDTKLLSQLAFLCNMAYVIPELKAKDLRRYYRLCLVTSSVEKKADAAALKAKLEEDSVRVPVQEKVSETEKKQLTRPSVAYEIAASAASYVQAHTKGLLSLTSEPQHGTKDEKSCENGEESKDLEKKGSTATRMYKSEVAAYVAASTMTSVVAAGKQAKLEAARDLQSLQSSPCEWFVCDDFSTYTRCFVIQGSDSVASWHANLFFEPTKFEGRDVLVHRGIYEAAKGIYEQFMPEIMDHLNTFGDRAKLQFTGHSLGGSLALLVNLMLLARNVVKPCSLRPVVTFGSPFVFCGGQTILDEFGLDQNNVQSVMMHRDVVPRAFSCNYPNSVAQLLKRLNGTFRSHPCLNKNKFLYSPMGKIFILQPDEKSSPPHPLLPHGSALYSLDNTQRGTSTNALRTFLNTPHPLETLSDPSAYGSEGTILRDHDSSNYLKAVNGVLKQHTKMIVRKVRNERHLVWPMTTTSSSENRRMLSKEIMTNV